MRLPNARRDRHQRHPPKAVRRLHARMPVPLLSRPFTSAVPCPLLHRRAAMDQIHMRESCFALAGGSQPWRLAARCLLQQLKVGARHARPPVDRVVVALCAHSHLSSHLGAAEAGCYTERSVFLVGLAALVTRLFPTFLCEEGWVALLRELLCLNQLGITMPPSADASPIDDRIAEASVPAFRSADEHEAASAPGESLVCEAISRAATVAVDAAEDLFRFQVPPAAQPGWTTKTAYQQALQPIQPHMALSAASRLPPAQLGMLVRASLRVADETMRVAIRSPLLGSLPAASAIQLLEQLLLSPQTTKTLLWALTTGCDFLGRIVATPGCPPPALHAATHALRQLQATHLSGVG